MAILVGVSQMLIVSAASGRIFDDVQAVPGPRPVLLLGCVRTLGGGYANPFFERRVEAAARLFREGKASAIIVSGDNHRRGYDEPTDMKEALVALGVPKEKVYCDYAGFRTLDSIVRAKKVFGQTRITIVSQRFHNERSLYLAQANGLDAVAYNAEDIKLEWALKTYVREAFARVKAVLDVNLLRTQPKFLGPPVRLDQPAQDAPAAASGT
jgi:SanA protein